MDKENTKNKKPSAKNKDENQGTDPYSIDDIYKKVGSSDDSVYDDYDNDDREPIGRLEKLLLRHIAENRASRKVLKEIEAFRGHLELHHKIIYAFLVFFGAVLIWYGMWQIVAMIPYLNHPVVAVVFGSLMLAFAGAFFRKVK